MPSSPSTRRGDGARHASTGPMLGSQRDAEDDAPLPLDGTGDDVTDTGSADDEDGVTIANSFTVAPGGPGRATVQVTGSSGNANLYGWVDFNRDGDVADAGEQIADGTGSFASLSDGAVAHVPRVPPRKTPHPSFRSSNFRVFEALDRVAAVAGPGAAGQELTCARPTRRSRCSTSGPRGSSSPATPRAPSTCPSSSRSSARTPSR